MNNLTQPPFVATLKLDHRRHIMVQKVIITRIYNGRRRPNSIIERPFYQGYVLEHTYHTSRTNKFSNTVAHMTSFFDITPITEEEATIILLGLELS